MKYGLRTAALLLSALALGEVQARPPAYDQISFPNTRIVLRPGEGISLFRYLNFGHGGYGECGSELLNVLASVRGPGRVVLKSNRFNLESANFVGNVPQWYQFALNWNTVLCRSLNDLALVNESYNLAAIDHVTFVVDRRRAGGSLPVPPPRSPAYRSEYVRCESSSNRYEECHVRTGVGYDLRIDRQHSSAACVKNRTYGINSRGSVWVDRGCRATFEVFLR